MKNRKRKENLKIGWRHHWVFPYKKQFLVIVVKMQKQIAKFSGLAKFCWFSYILQNILSLIVGICTIFSYFAMTLYSRLWTMQKLFPLLSCTLPKRESLQTYRLCILIFVYDLFMLHHLKLTEISIFYPSITCKLRKC